MKLVNYTVNGITRAGAIVKEQVIDLNHAFEAKLQAEGEYRYKEIAHAYVPATTDGIYEGGKNLLNWRNKLSTSF